MIRVQHYLGDRVVVESWLNQDSENDMAWLDEWEREARAALHPEVRLVVTYYEAREQNIYRPENPLPLSEVVG